MRQPTSPIHESDFTVTPTGFRWLDLLRNYTYDIQEVTVNVDLPNLAANSTIVHAITATGVSVGDYIISIVTTSYTDEWCIVHAQVTATDTISLQVHRGKSGSYDPAAEDMTFVYIRNTK